MGIIVEELDADNASQVNACDGQFDIDGILIPNIQYGEIEYEIRKVPQTKKRYENDDIDYLSYIDNPDKTIYLVKVDRQIAGQIILRKNWNNYAYVEDIAVDVKYRRQGIGRKLIVQAKHWAQERNLAGIMLETQNNNLRACKFYQACGFRLGGVDKYLYKGIDRETDEIALYWYMIFEELPSSS